MTTTRYFIVLLIVEILHARKHTIYYQRFFNRSPLNRFFNNETFGLRLFGDDPCRIVTNQKFREMINDYFDGCTAEYWCVNGRYSCPRYTKRNCWEVEHIYDVNRPEFDNIKNIIANRVMAWGKWNGALGKLSYEWSLREKRDIYGNETMQNVYDALEYCRRRKPQRSKITTLVLILLYIGLLMGLFYYFGDPINMFLIN